MKAALFSLTAVSLVNLSQAQPAHAGHEHFHRQRDVMYETAYVTAQGPVVYVDQNGNTLSQVEAAQPTAAPQAAATTLAPVAAPPAAPAAPVQQAPAPVYQAAKPSYPQAVSAAAAAPSVKPSVAAVPSVPGGAAPSAGAGNVGGNKPSSNDNNGLGINYSPYHSDGSCKSTAEVNNDFAQLNGYSIVRSYGVDCNQVPNMISAAKAKNMKIMLGVFHVNQASSEMDTLIQGVGNDWDIVDTVTVGNEAVNSGQASPSDCVAALGTARSKLQATPFNGSVAIVDTFDTLISHPQLCQQSDYAAANAHAFFDAQTSADQAGTWAKGTVQRVQQACGKRVIITESGWPSQGASNGAAVPSRQNQQAAMSSLKGAFSNGGLFLFSAYNDYWKQDFPGSYGCEKYWGIYGDSSN